MLAASIGMVLAPCRPGRGRWSVGRAMVVAGEHGRRAATGAACLAMAPSSRLAQLRDRCARADARGAAPALIRVQCGVRRDAGLGGAAGVGLRACERRQR